MDYFRHFAWEEDELVDFLNKLGQSDWAEFGDGFRAEICVAGLTLMVHYGWSQKDLHKAWPTLFGERSAL